MMMNIRTRILLSLGFTLFLTWLLAFFILDLFVVNVFNEIERNQVESTKRNIRQIFHNKEHDLLSRVRDWAYWDSTYQFIKHKNLDFIRSNISDDILANYRVDGVAFLDKKHELVYLYADDDKRADFQTNIQDQLQKLAVTNQNLELPYLSAVKLGATYYLVAVAKITPTRNWKNEYNGYLYFYQEIGTSQLDYLSKASGTKLKFIAEMTEEKADYANDNKLFMYYPLKNRNGITIGILEGELDRVYVPLLKLVRLSIVIGSAALAIVFVFAIYYLLNCIVLKPLKRIEEQTKLLASDKRHKDRMEVTGTDEFSTLACTINTMLDEREKMQRNLQHKSQLMSLGELASGIAHEINNPLTIVLLSVDKLKRRFAEKLSEEPEMEKLVDKIQLTGNRISKIVSGMRSLSKNVDPNERNLINVGKLIEEAVELYKERAKDLDIELQLQIDEEEIFAMVNATQISQVVVNLMTNAFDVLETKLQKKIIIQLRAFKTDPSGTFQIRVADNGDGVPDELKEKIMQPFFTTKNSQKGTGLGLSICHEIVELHGGKMSFSRQYISGEEYTVFSIELKKHKGLFNKVA